LHPGFSNDELKHTACVLDANASCKTLQATVQQLSVLHTQSLVVHQCHELLTAGTDLIIAKDVVHKGSKRSRAAGTFVTQVPLAVPTMSFLSTATYHQRDAGGVVKQYIITKAFRTPKGGPSMTTPPTSKAVLVTCLTRNFQCICTRIVTTES
jgi:hypothetical protein